MKVIEDKDLKILEKYFKVPTNIEFFKISESLDKKYSVGFQLDSSKLAYYSNSLLKAFDVLNRNLLFNFKVKLLSYQLNPKKEKAFDVNFLEIVRHNLDFKDALIFKRRVRAARLRKAKQRKK